MPKSPLLEQCPIAFALDHVGDSWSFLIMRDAGRGLTRYDEFQRSLGIAPNILSRRLAALAEAGMLERRRYSEHPPRDEYLLTEAGRDFLPILFALGAWSHRHGDGKARTVARDAVSGALVNAIVIDEDTGRPIGSFETRLETPPNRPVEGRHDN